jgi:hypothetical protein
MPGDDARAARDARDDQPVRQRVLDLPMFDDGPGSISAQNFITRVDYARKIGNWSDANTARYVILALQGKALTWVQILINEDSAALDSWKALKPLFKARFHCARTMCEKAALRLSLVQKESESVLDFLDRCRAAEDILMSGVPVPEGADKVVFQLFYNNDVILNFVSGLKPAIQERVIDAGGDSLETIKESAIRAERALETKRPSTFKKGIEISKLDLEVVSQHGDEDPPDDDEIREAVLFLRQRRGKTKPRQQNQRNQQRNPTTRRIPPTSQEPKRLICWYCDKPGHREQDCFKRQRENVPTRGPPQGRKQELHELPVREEPPEPHPSQALYAMFGQGN